MRIQKVWLNRVWFMVGQEVLLTEEGTPSRMFEKVWLHQIHPPFFQGSGRSFRFGNWGMRIGTCRPQVKSPLFPWFFPYRRNLYWVDTDVDFDAELGYALAGDTSIGTERVRSWDASSPSESTSESPSSPAS